MYFKGKIICIFVVTVALFASWTMEGIGAEKYTASEWAVIINLSGKQRMLTQKMCKEIFLISTGIDPDVNRAELQKTSDLFERILKGLQKGDSELNLRGAKSTITKKTLVQIEDIWLKFKSEVFNVLNGFLVPEEEIADLNIPLLKRCNTVVKIFEKESHMETGGKASMVINYAGRQRMLIQKMSKEMLLVYLYYKIDESKASLAKTVEWFEVTLNALRNGGKVPRGRNKFVELPPTTDQTIIAQLNKVEGLWDEFKPLTSDINDENMKKMAVLNLPLLKEMNKAVKMYEKAQ